MKIADKIIADDVRAAIERKRNIDIEDVDISVDRGVITLTGTVPDWEARRAAVNAAEFTKGVTDVKDELTVQRLPLESGKVC